MTRFISEIKAILKPYKWLHHMLSNKKIIADELWSSRLSFSQFGEDLILDALFEMRGIKSGTYIEVGAFDPIIMSNSYFFYKKGWRGICIEPNPLSFQKICKRRPADINLNVAVSNREGEVSFVCDEAKSGIFDKNYLFTKLDQNVISVPTVQLVNILENHLDSKQKIAFMSVDCEGHDLEVLNSNDWCRFRPLVVLVEDHSEGKNNLINEFLLEKNYVFYGRSAVTAFYTDKSFWMPCA